MQNINIEITYGTAVTRNYFITLSGYLNGEKVYFRNGELFRESWTNLTKKVKTMRFKAAMKLLREHLRVEGSERITPKSRFVKINGIEFDSMNEAEEFAKQLALYVEKKLRLNFTTDYSNLISTTSTIRPSQTENRNTQMRSRKYPSDLTFKRKKNPALSTFSNNYAYSKSGGRHVN